MSKVKIHWRCPVCDFKNHWKWDEDDIMAGEIAMECDSCHCLSDMLAYFHLGERRWRFIFLGSFFTKNKERRFVIG